MLLQLINNTTCTCTCRFSLINWVGNVNWPLLRVEKLTLQALALPQSLWARANAQKVSLYSSQFTLSTQLIILDYPLILYFRNLPLLLTVYHVWLLSLFTFCRITNLFKISLLSWVWMSCLKMTNWQWLVQGRSRDSSHSLSRLLRFSRATMASLFPYRYNNIDIHFLLHYATEKSCFCPWKLTDVC